MFTRFTILVERGCHYSSFAGIDFDLKSIIEEKLESIKVITSRREGNMNFWTKLYSNPSNSCPEILLLDHKCQPRGDVRFEVKNPKKLNLWP